MDSVVLCAGEGRRVGAVTGGGNKCLTEVPGHGVILDYSLRTALGLTNGAIVVVGHGADEVRRHIDSFAAEKFPRANVQVVEQGDRKGICGAILCCEALLGGQDFLLFLGDEIITEPTHAGMIKEFFGVPAAGAGIASCGYVRAQNIGDARKTYSLELLGGKIVDIVEKPSRPVNDLMGTGNCLFRNRFFDYIRQYAKERGDSGKARFSFPDVLKYAMCRGETAVAYEIGKAYLNLNEADDIASFLHQCNKQGA